MREIEGEGEKTIGEEGKERCSLVVVVVSGDWELLLRLLAGEEARRRLGAAVICSPAS